MHVTKSEISCFGITHFEHRIDVCLKFGVCHMGRLRKDKGDKVRTSKPGPSAVTPSSIVAPQTPKNVKLLIQPTPDWYSVLSPLPPPSTPFLSPTAAQITVLTTRATELHATEASNFSTAPHSTLAASSSDQAFLKNILASGTLSDRLSALTLMVQSSPLHNTRGLDVLKGMAEKGKGGGGSKDRAGGQGGGRDERLKAARAIADWWVGGGAPGRKLVYFRDQPLLHPAVTDQHLLLWYFEDWLKKYFFSFLQLLEVLSLDTLAYARMQTLTLIFTLLRDKPEQEHNLLRLLVNKLGDTEKSVCSRASYHILQLLQAHPIMKSIVIREMTALIMRPTSASNAASSLTAPPAAKPRVHIKFTDGDAPAKPTPGAKPQEKSTWNIHARYYATTTFNQVVLSTSEEDRKAARMLMDVYFQLFREVVGERSAPDAAAEGKEEADGETEEKGQGKGKGKGKDARRGEKKNGKERAKEVQGAAGFAEVQDSNSRLVSAILTGVNRAMPYARFGGGDVEFERHMDTLFLITHTSTFNITLQALTLIQHTIASLPSSPASSTKSLPSGAIASRYFRTLYATLLDPRLYTSSKQAMYLNLLFKSLKSDSDKERVKAFVKRLCQLFNTVPGLKSMVDKSNETASTDESQKYDPRKRDPQYAHASSSPLWELTPLLHHAHPTLSLLARQLLAHQPLTTSPDLTLHTLTHFLDRFVYKNPKKVKPKGASAMQPVAAVEGDGVRRMRGQVQETPVNEEGWWRRNEGSVPADQVFFLSYFSQKHEKERAKAAKADKRKNKKDDSDAEQESGMDDEEEEVEEAGGQLDEDSDAEEAEIWKAMQASMPVLDHGDDDLIEDSDEIPSGLDDSENEDVVEKDGSAGAASDDDAFSMVEASDAEDLIDLDEDEPNGLIDYNGSDVESGGEEEEEWAGFENGAGGKRKRGYKDKGMKNKRKKIRSLPTFASYEDYAKMIEDGPEDNV
ncbi:hypothetical protein EW146_g4548 [Bondarzewia mesenterica]|uniref:CCAAT-binding factor domain-containing protein n=1 Tax=Bondarzewia mesenterica TaxID=1095465 RepID=A0A4S4LVD8_9AGAM|nr:hypothetical protein EW146_g4548 [Bondarzewia mesenterica]